MRKLEPLKNNQQLTMERKVEVILRDHGIQLLVDGDRYVVVDKNPFSGTTTQTFTSLCQLVDHYCPRLQDDRLFRLYI
jgi:hypothetical protein